MPRLASIGSCKKGPAYDRARILTAAHAAHGGAGGDGGRSIIMAAQYAAGIAAGIAAAIDLSHVRAELRRYSAVIPDDAAGVGVGILGPDVAAVQAVHNTRVSAVAGYTADAAIPTAAASDRAGVRAVTGEGVVKCAGDAADVTFSTRDPAAVDAAGDVCEFIRTALDAAGDAADIGTAADGDRAHAVGYGARISVSRDRAGVVPGRCDGAGDGEVFDRRVKDIAEKAPGIRARVDIKPRHRVAAAVECAVEGIEGRLVGFTDRRPRHSAEVDVGGEVDRLAFEYFSAGVDELREPREVRRCGDVEVRGAGVVIIPLRVCRPRRRRGPHQQPAPQRRRADKREQRQAEALRAAAALPGRKSQLLNDLPDESHL